MPTKGEAMRSTVGKWTAALIAVAAAGVPLVNGRITRVAAQGEEPTLLPTGKAITPMGQHTPLGSVPLNVVMSRDGQYLVTTSNGFKQYLHVVSAADGTMRDQIPFQVFSDTPPKPGVFEPTGS